MRSNFVVVVCFDLIVLCVLVIMRNLFVHASRFFLLLFVWDDSVLFMCLPL